MGGDIHRLPILLELLLLRRFAKHCTNYWKVLQTKFLLNKVANAKQTCPRFLLPLGFCIRFFQVLHCNVSDCCSNQQKLESWTPYKSWYGRLFVVNFLYLSFEKKCMLILNNRLITLDYSRCVNTRCLIILHYSVSGTRQ